MITYTEGATSKFLGGPNRRSNAKLLPNKQIHKYRNLYSDLNKKLTSQEVAKICNLHTRNITYAWQWWANNIRPIARTTKFWCSPVRPTLHRPLYDTYGRQQEVFTFINIRQSGVMALAEIRQVFAAIDW